MEINFCRRCGSEFKSSNEHVFRCVQGHTIYANASPAVGIILENSKQEIMVLERAYEPNKGGYDLPGGFCDGDETLELALARELLEETGLRPQQYTKPDYIISGIDNYTFAEESLSVLSCVFYSRLIDDNAKIVANDDAASITFIKPNAGLADSLSFPSLRLGLHEFLKHTTIIRQANNSKVQ